MSDHFARPCITVETVFYTTLFISKNYTVQTKKLILPASNKMSTKTIVFIVEVSLKICRFGKEKSDLAVWFLIYGRVDLVALIRVDRECIE